MSLIAAIGRTALKALHPNNGLVFRECQVLPIFGSIRLANMFGHIGRESDSKVPLRPRRPQNGYSMFYKDLWARLRAQNPDLKLKELAKTIGTQWRQLDEKTKEEFKEKAKTGSEEYKQELEKWKNSLTDKQMESISIETKTRRRLLARRRLKGELKQLDYPIRAKTGLNLFIREALQRRDKSEAIPEAFKRAAAKWSSLSPSEKEVYEQSAKSDKLRFLEELEEWKKKMSRRENKDLLNRLTKLKSMAGRSGLTVVNTSEQKKKPKKKKVSTKAKTKTIKAKTKTTKAKAKPKSKSKTTSKAKTTKKSAKPKTDEKSKKVTKKSTKEDSNSSDESDKEKV